MKGTGRDEREKLSENIKFICRYWQKQKVVGR